MRNILLNVAVSLDGLIAGPHGEYDWCFVDKDYGMKDFLARIDALLMGRKSYELMKEMGEPFPGLRKIVVSQTLTSVEWWAEQIKGDAIERIKQMRGEAGKDIWLFGGAQLTNSLLAAGLVDELHLSVHPVVLGGGVALFGSLARRIKVELMETRGYETGLVQNIYRVRKEGVER